MVKKDLSDLVEQMTTAEIQWHITTPQYFECQPKCMVCCEQTYYLPQEIKSLPKPIIAHLGMQCLYCGTSHLYYKSNGLCDTCGQKTVIKPLPFDEENDFGCFFFNIKASGRHCTIYGYRPLRCRLFPYIPLFMHKTSKIVIVAEDFIPSIIHPSAREKTLATEDFRRCYGLGLGEPINKKEVEQNSRQFLLMLASAVGYEGLFQRLVIENIPINLYEVQMHKKTVSLMKSGDDLTKYFQPNNKWQQKEPFKLP